MNPLTQSKNTTIPRILIALSRCLAVPLLLSCAVLPVQTLCR